MQILFEIFGVRDFLPSDDIIHWLAKCVCSEKDLETYCSDIIFYHLWLRQEAVE